MAFGASAFYRLRTDIAGVDTGRVKAIPADTAPIKTPPAAARTPNSGDANSKRAAIPAAETLVMVDHFEGGIFEVGEAPKGAPRGGASATLLLPYRVIIIPFLSYARRHKPT
jgi:hypothetical protein